MLFDFNNSDLCEHLNKYMEIYDILNLRKSFKNNFKILESHKFIRNITFGKQNYINKIDKYDINIIIYDNYTIFNNTDMNLISNYNKVNIEIFRAKLHSNVFFIGDNYNLLEFIKKLLNDNKINILYIDVNTFYVLCNYFKSNVNNLKLNTLHIKMSESYDKFLYWDLTLHNLKECLKYFKLCKNLIFGNVVVCETYLNLLKKYDIIHHIEILENIDDDYLKKNNIKVKIVINSSNINKQNVNYNIYFDCEHDLLNNRNRIWI